MNDIDNPFTGKHLIPRSPPPPSKSSPTHSQSPTESPVKPTQPKTAVSSPKKKIIRPQNPTQSRQKDIPIEIHVAPKLINPNPSKLKGKDRSYHMTGSRDEKPTPLIELPGHEILSNEVKTDYTGTFENSQSHEFHFNHMIKPNRNF